MPAAAGRRLPARGRGLRRRRLRAGPAVRGPGGRQLRGGTVRDRGRWRRRRRAEPVAEGGGAVRPARVAGGGLQAVPHEQVGGMYHS